MPLISERDFSALALRVHALLADVPLHDVWAVDLPASCAGITLNEFLDAADDTHRTLSPVVRSLLAVRFFVGRIFRWDRIPSAAGSHAFAQRLTPDDRARSLICPGEREGPFSVVYRFENEQLLEIANKTAHAAALSALIEIPGGYRYFFAIYVRNVSRLTPLYMALIDPVRKWIVYPSLLRGVRADWDRVMSAR